MMAAHGDHTTRDEYQQREGALCLQAPPRRAATSSGCVKPEGHTDRFCQHELKHTTGWARTDVLLVDNPNWNGVDVYETTFAAADRERYAAECAAVETTVVIPATKEQSHTPEPSS